jgi:hypothetical protein
VLPVQQINDLDWPAVREAALAAPQIRERMRLIVQEMEIRLDEADGPGLLFDGCRTHAEDKAILVSEDLYAQSRERPLWVIGDLHGDLLALEASLALIAARSECAPRIVFLGDLFDDEGLGLETMLRVFELILHMPGRVCLVAGNHDEALSFDGARFASSVNPSDFADQLNANLAHEWVVRAAKLMVRLTASAPRALFFPDGLLIAHGGFPLVDLHAKLLETGDWNDPACLSDFVWSRAHPKARRKMPNRFSRGSQFGFEDFADFCKVSAMLGRRVTHMVRGHDHPEDRVALYPAYHQHPLLTTVALSRRLPRERFGPYERCPSLARVVPGSLPQPYQLQIPPELVREVFPMVETPLDCETAVQEPS